MGQNDATPGARAPDERRYGPHDPETAPTHEPVILRSRWGPPREVPIHPVILQQRDHINTRAYERGRQ